jgi:hypothetical protein
MNNFFSRLGFGSRKHVTDEELLACMDGEVPSGTARRIRRHLESCWSCRKRYEELQAAIFGFMDYRKRQIARYMPPPQGGRVRFLEKLHNEAAKPPALWCARIFNTFRSKVAIGMNPVLSACLILVGVVLAAILLGRNPATVSASELLKKAELSETKVSVNPRRALISQRVRISSTGATLEYLLYRDSQGRRHPRSSQLNKTGLELKRRLELAGVDWRQPLSAADFHRWHDRLSDRHDTVSSDNTTLTLLTSTTSSVVNQTSLTVRKVDFHPTRRRIVFNDLPAIEISELNFDVSDWNEVTASSVFEPDTASLPVAPDLPKAAEPIPARPSLAALDEAELRARLALNKVNADFGEQIVIRQSQSYVEVTGIVETKERKQELENSLGGILLVRTSLQSIEEIPQRSAPLPSQPTEEYSATHESQLQLYLASRSQNPEQVAKSGHELLEASIGIQREVHALDFLSTRFPATARINLSPSANATLKELVSRHKETLGSAINAERILVDHWATAAPSRSEPKSYAGYDDLRLAAGRNKELCDELLSTRQTNPRAVGEILSDLQESIWHLDVIFRHLDPIEDTR